jgi:tetratricopeptide (TPR) repeat protein
MNKSIYLLCIVGTVAAPLTAASDQCLEKVEKALRVEEYSMGLKVLSKCEKSARWYRLKGLIHYSLFQADSAIANLQKAYGKKIDDDDLLIALAEARLWKKDFKHSGAVLEQVEDKNDARYRRVRAMYFELLGNYKKALELYDEILDSDPAAFAIALKRAQVLSWMKRFEESIDGFNAIINATEVSKSVKMDARVRRAEVFAWDRNFEKALQELDAIIEEDTTLIEPRLIKGQIYEWQGKFADAKDVYKDILVIDEDNTQAKVRIEKLLWVK